MKLKREIEYQNSHIFYSFSGSSGSEREKNVTIFVKKRAKYMYMYSDIANNFIVNFQCRLRYHRTCCVPIFDKEKLNTSYWGRRRENGAIPLSSFFCEKMD